MHTQSDLPQTGKSVLHDSRNYALKSHVIQTAVETVFVFCMCVLTVNVSTKKGHHVTQKGQYDLTASLTFFRATNQENLDMRNSRNFGQISEGLR